MDSKLKALWRRVDAVAGADAPPRGGSATAEDATLAREALIQWVESFPERGVALVSTLGGPARVAAHPELCGRLLRALDVSAAPACRALAVELRRADRELG